MQKFQLGSKAHTNQLIRQERYLELYHTSSNEKEINELKLSGNCEREINLFVLIEI